MTENAIARTEGLLDRRRQAHLLEPDPPATVRVDRIRRVADAVRRHRADIHAALDEDFGGHPAEQSDLNEVLIVLERAEYVSHHVASWMKPQRRSVNPVLTGRSKASIRHQPKGVVANMVSWNFPFDIGFGPTIDALGAGNRVVIKPSELSPACGEVMEQMVAEAFDETEVAVVNGGLDLARAFPAMAWDHLIYTGSGAVGRQVAVAAAANLVPVTLELGGKCPAVIAPDKVDDPEVARTIAGAKAIKRGQMCVSVDHVLAPSVSVEKVVSHLVDAFGGPLADDNGSAHACGIVSERHLARLEALLDDARARGAEVIRVGQDRAPDRRNLAFHVVVDPPPDAAVMQEEIFGPILPVVGYLDVGDAIARIGAADQPLGIYAFSDDEAWLEPLVRRTRSGGVAINSIAAQAAMPSMGFGGVGPSGTGRHHGIEGFHEFSNPRGCYEQGAGGLADRIFPPYGPSTRDLIERGGLGSTLEKARFGLPLLARDLLRRGR